MKVGMILVDCKTVPPEMYDEKYYLTDCGGYKEFISSQGLEPVFRINEALAMGTVKPGMKVLDVGCGRGEILIQCALLGAYPTGIDYSADAVKIAAGAINALPQECRDRIELRQEDARRMNFAGSSFDVVFMLDIVEHLYPDELQQALAEVNRVLRPGGLLVIHTAPNIWYCNYGYQMVRLIFNFKNYLLGNKEGYNPRIHPSMEGMNRIVHVNLQNPVALKRTLEQAGFISRLSVKDDGLLTGRNPMNKVFNRIFRSYPLRMFFSFSIYLRAEKVR